MSYNKNTKMWEGYIYKIINDINNIIYIGQTITTLHNRFNGHKSTAKNKPFSCNIASAINKYGIEHFKIIEIKKIENINKKEVQDQLNQLEIEYIAKYKEDGIELYNMTAGGDLQRNTWPEKSVIQYDLFCKEINRFKSISDAENITGVCHSDISTCCSKNGKLITAGGYIWRFSDDHLTVKEIIYYNKKYPGVCQYDYDGNILNVFYTIKEAVEKLCLKNNSSANISACCRGKHISAYGYVWRYRNDSFDKYTLPKKHRKIEQRDKTTGELIAKFNSFAEAARITNSDDSSINQCCNGNNYTSNGYIWCYEGENFEINHKKKYLNARFLVDMYSIDKEFIKTFESIAAATKETKIDRNAISKACRNIIHHAGGFVWKFHNDNIDTYKFNECLC